MATAKNTKTKKDVNIENKSTDNSKIDIVSKYESEISDLKSQLESQKDAMEALMKQVAGFMNNQQAPSIQIVKDTTSENRKVKVISCINCTLNLTTEPYGNGTIYKFNRFGESHNINLRNLEKCVHNNRNSFVRGDCYICDKEAVIELGLADAYERLYSAEELNNIILLKDGELDVERICGMGVYDEYTHSYVDMSPRDNAIDAIAQNMAKGISYDRNLIHELEVRLDINMDDKIKKVLEISDKK